MKVSLILRIIQLLLLVLLFIHIFVSVEKKRKLRAIAPIDLVILRYLQKDKKTETKNMDEVRYVEVMINMEPKLIKLMEPLSKNQKHVKVHVNENGEYLVYYEGRDGCTTDEDILAMYHKMASVNTFTKVMVIVLCVMLSLQYYDKYSTYAKESVAYSESIGQTVAETINKVYDEWELDVKAKYAVATILHNINRMDYCDTLSESQINIIMDNSLYIIATGEHTLFDMPKSIDPINNIVLKDFQEYYTSLADILHKIVVLNEDVTEQLDALSRGFAIRSYLILLYEFLSGFTRIFIWIYLSGKVFINIIYKKKVKKYRKDLGIM